MKRFYKFLMPLVMIMALALPWNTRAQATVEIGTDQGTTTNSYLPMYTLYNNTLSEQIYTADEIGMPGLITSVAFYNGGSEKTPNVKIYMINTSRTDFSSTTDWLPVTASDLVFDGTVTFTAGQWTTITLDNPFMYDGASNLGLIFDGNLNWSSGLACRVFNSTTNCAMYVYSDPTDYNAVGATYTASSRLSVKNQLKLEIIPANMSCYWPINLAISGVDSNEATLSWGDTNGATTWRVYWAPADTPALIDSVDVNDSTYTFTGLNANTLYNVSVMTVCDTSNSIVKSTSFRTLCGITTAPFTEGFEGRTTGDVPYCWTQVATGTSGSGTFPSIYNYASNARTGSAYFEFESTTGQTEVAVLPSVDNLTGLRLRFYAACTNHNFVLEAGVMEDTDFVVVDTVSLTTATSFSSNAYHEYTVYYNNYNGMSNRMAMRVTAAGSYTLMIDDLTVEEIPACPTPSYLTLDSVGTDWAALSWVENGSASEWIIEYDTVPFTPGANTTATSVNANDTYITLTNLDTGFTYYVYLHADCGGDTSQNILLQFNTLAGDPATVPYECMFENGGVNGWEFANEGQTNYWMVGNATNNGGSHSMYITNNGSANEYTISTTSNSYAFRVFNLPDTGEYVYSFDWKGYGESCCDYGRVALMPGTFEPVAGNTTFAVATGTNVPGAVVDLSNGSRLNLANNWATVSGTFRLSTPGVYKMVFFWHNDPSVGTNPPIAVDNISLNLNTCPAPVALTVDSLMPTQIDVHWSSTGTETEWALRVGDSLITNITDTFYSVTGLEQYTQYIMRVYAVCGAEDTSLASTPISARTTYSCPWPTQLTATYVGQDTLIVSWHAGGEETEWEVAIGNETPVSVYDTTYIFDGLNANTGYTVMVRAICGSDDISAWTTGTFRTACGNVVLPFLEGFEDATALSCWTQSGSGQWSVGTGDYSSSTGTHSGNGNALITHSSSGNVTKLITPVLDLSNVTSAVNLNFWHVQRSWAGDQDELRVYYRVASDSSWILLAAYTDEVATWTEEAITLPNPSATYQIAFEMTDGYGYGVAIDDISCRTIECPYANEIHVEQVSSGSVILGYTILGISDSSTYDDLTIILTSPTDSTSQTLHPTSDNHMAITGLDSNTTYVAQLFAACSGVETDTVSCTFTTSALPCAVVDQALTDTVQIGNGTSTSYYIPIGNFYNYSYTQQLILASELNGAMSISGIDFQYAYSSPSTAKTNVSIYMANVSQTSLSSGFVPYSNSFTLVYTGAMNCTQGWNHFQFTSPFSYDGTSNLLIVVHDNSGDYDGTSYNFYTHSATGKGRYVQNDSSPYNIQSVSGGTTYDYRANMKLYTFGCQQQATCNAPLVMVDSTTTNSAIVNIYPGYQETSWTVEYRIAGDSTWTMSGTATTTSYTVTGLQSGKHYQIRVSTACDGTSFGTTVVATTQCDVVAVTPTTPYFENFEGGAPVCWTQQHVHGQYNWLLGTETFVYHNSTYQHGEGAAELYQQSNSSDTAITKLITDAFNFTALPNGARLRFYNAQLSYQTYGQPTLYLYYRTSSNDAWTVFDSIVTAVTDFTQHEFILPNSTGAPYYQIAFEGHCPYGYGLNIDDVLIDANPACSRPIITSTIPNGATATISWTGNANNYIVSYHPFYDTVAPWTTVNVTGTTTTLTGLTTGEYYELTVTGDCGATDGQSDPSAPVFFYVPCAAQTVPYTENFDSYTSDLCYIANSSFAGFDNYPYVQLPNCWMFPNQSHQGISPAALLFHDSINAFPTNCLWINARTGRDHYSVLPLMSAPIDTLVLLFDYLLSSESMVIGVVTDPNDITTFIGIDTLTDASGSVEHYFSTDNINWIAGQDYYIAFHTFGSYYAFIDNIQVVYQPHCMKVANLHMVSAGASSITLDWTNSSTGGTPVAYQIRYIAQGSTTANYSIVTSNPATISGLTSLTSYTMAVRPICGVGDTAFWSDAITATTAMCDNPTYAQNFNTASTETSSYSPLGTSFYNYGYVQTLIDSADMAAISGDITAMAFYPASTSQGNYYSNMDIYLANVPENSLASGFIQPDSTTHVFVQVLTAGNLNYTTTDEQLVSFDAPFTWDGHSNVLVVVNRKHGTYASGASFSAHTASVAKTRYAYTDGSAYNPYNITVSGTSSTTVGNLKLISCGGGCSMPGALHTTNVAYNSVSVAWSGTDSAEVGIHQGLWDVTGATIATVTTNSYTFTGLTPNTQYTVAVRNLCPDDMTSEWTYLQVTTDDLPCFAPTNVQVSNETPNGAKVTWTAGGNETEWVVNVFRSGVIDTNYTVINTPMCNVSGLYSAMTYTVKVGAVCGGIDTMWSETTTFTTTACLPPTNVTATANGHQAIVTWEGSGANEYHVLWFLQGFTTDGDSVIATNGTTNATIDGLEGGEDYDIYVYAYCDGQRSAQAGQTQLHVTGIDDINTSAINLYPNPANTTVTVDGIEGEALVTIVDMNGRTVFSEKTVSSITIDLNGMAKGAYFVRITGENSSAIRKLIVK